MPADVPTIAAVSRSPPRCCPGSQSRDCRRIAATRPGARASQCRGAPGRCWGRGRSRTRRARRIPRPSVGSGRSCPIPCPRRWRRACAAPRGRPTRLRRCGGRHPAVTRSRVRRLRHHRLPCRTTVQARGAARGRWRRRPVGCNRRRRAPPAGWSTPCAGRRARNQPVNSAASSPIRSRRAVMVRMSSSEIATRATAGAVEVGHQLRRSSGRWATACCAAGTACAGPSPCRVPLRCRPF